MFCVDWLLRLFVTTTCISALISVGAHSQEPGDNAKILEIFDTNIPLKSFLTPTLKKKHLVPDKNGFVTFKLDPNIVKADNDFVEDKTFLSPPSLGYPIYACSSNVTVANYIHHAKIEVFVDNNPVLTKNVVHPSVGTNLDLGVKLQQRQTVKVRQIFDGQTSDWSDVVPVTSHLEDYPNGLPRPRVWNDPLRKCGRAVLVTDVVPGSTVSVFSKQHGTSNHNPIGLFKASTRFGQNWTRVNPEFQLNSDVTARATLCKSESPRSFPKVPKSGPDPVPDGALETPIVIGSDSAVVLGAGGADARPENGAVITVSDRGSQIARFATPGGLPHQVSLNPKASSASSYRVTQTLCASSPGTQPPITPVPCNQLPAPTIRPPLPGDRQVHVTRHVPGARILVFANNEEVGDSGGNVINLKRPLVEGETVRVIQRLDQCQGDFIYRIAVKCHLGEDPSACSSDWPTFRHSGLRDGQQSQRSVLADPYKVKTLEVKKSIRAPDGGRFRASPVVHKGMVYLGSSNGHLYAFDAQTLKVEWQYPPTGHPALTSSWATSGSCNNPSSEGLAASVAMAKIDNIDVVILGAPDQGRPTCTNGANLKECDPNGKFGNGLGSGRLFALHARVKSTGQVFWKSKEIAKLTGTTQGDINELHEQIGYSAPLVLGNRIYVGIGDHCDNPIQKGKVIAVELNTGKIIKDFKFEATQDPDKLYDRGGGVWTYVSGGLAKGIFTTTGNTKLGSREPVTNHGLSMIRLDPAKGTLEGKIQPVPWEQDGDPDWAAGTTLIASRCGDLSVSTMKDGYSYAAGASKPLSFRWQFPPVAYPFPKNDPNDHGDIRFHRAGAAWNDVYVTMTGGKNIVSKNLPAEKWAGYRRLHALNICAGHQGRIRWIADLKSPFTSQIPVRERSARHFWGLGPPTVTHGIIYVGTNLGQLVALADPSVWPSQGSICSYDGVPENLCESNGFRLVAKPTVLKAINLNKGHIVRTEPVIAAGNLYVATENGFLVRIAPK